MGELFQLNSSPANGRAISRNLKPQERLLLLACSGEKAPTPNGKQLSPIDLYTGAMYSVLRKWMPGLDKATIRILSAKHSLITDEWPKITAYDERMSAQKAAHLIAGGIFAQFDGFGTFKRGHAKGASPADYLRPERGFIYRDVFIAAGAEYRNVFHAWIREMQRHGMIAPDASINEVQGGIGEQRGQLGQYLRWIANDVGKKEAA